MPEPELYVIYTGDRKSIPETISFISLSNDFCGVDIAIDVKIKVISEGNTDSIINRYIIFCKVYNEQMKLYGRTRETVTEAIRICKDRNVLKEYLESREKEVVSIMMSLFPRAMSQVAIPSLCWGSPCLHGYLATAARGAKRRWRLFSTDRSET